MEKPIFNAKVVLVGNSGVGKTTYVNRLKTGEFRKFHIPTLGVETLSTVKFQTSHGPISFELWDTAGKERFSGLKDGYYMEADAFLILVDVCNSDSCNSINKWHHDVHRCCPSIPCVVVGNKSDSFNGRYSHRSLQQTTTKLGNSSYVEISCKSLFHLQLPLEIIASKLLEDQDLQFLSLPTNDIIED